MVCLGAVAVWRAVVETGNNYIVDSRAASCRSQARAGVIVPSPSRSRMFPTSAALWCDRNRVYPISLAGEGFTGLQQPRMGEGLRSNIGLGPLTQPSLLQGRRRPLPKGEGANMSAEFVDAVAL